MQPVLVHDLHNRSVVTQGGTKLGSLKDVSIDCDSGRVIYYLVKQGLLGVAELMIASNEIIEIRPDVIIVKDGVVPVSMPLLA